MAGLADAGLTIYTVRSGGFFPTNDELNHYSPIPTSFTFASTCTDQWIIQDPLTSTVLTNPVPTSCLPHSTQAYNSPGTCISNYHMVALAEYRTTGWTSGGSRAWGAVCCREYVH